MSKRYVGPANFRRARLDESLNSGNIDPQPNMSRQFLVNSWSALLPCASPIFCLGSSLELPPRAARIYPVEDRFRNAQDTIIPLAIPPVSFAEVQNAWFINEDFADSLLVHLPFLCNVLHGVLRLMRIAGVDGLSQRPWSRVESRAHMVNLLPGGPSTNGQQRSDRRHGFLRRADAHLRRALLLLRYCS